jgi:nitrate reductase gamma subunit
VLNDTVLVVTDRGVFRSADAGTSWARLSAELPDHAEAAVLLHDPHASTTLYAGFSRTGIEPLKQLSSTPQPSYARSDVALLVGAYAGFALLLVGVGVVVRRITRASTAAVPAAIDDAMPAESPR